MFKGWFKRKYARIPIAEWSRAKKLLDRIDLAPGWNLAAFDARGADTITNVVAEFEGMKEVLGKTVNRVNDLPSQELFVKLEELPYATEFKNVAVIAELLRTVKKLQDDASRLPSKEDFDRVRNLAENAYDCVLGTLPDSGVTARKLDGAVVTTGLPNA